MLINKVIKTVVIMVILLNLAACDAALPGYPTAGPAEPNATSIPNPTSIPTGAPTAAPDTPAPGAPGRAEISPVGPVPAINGINVPPPTGPETGHPRLWLRSQDLPRLRAWAVDTNPLYRDGLARLAAQAKSEMDSKKVPEQDSGETTYVDYPTEMYAELFAFMSLISNDQAARDDYANRARTLLMYVINQAAKGQQKHRAFP